MNIPPSTVAPTTAYTSGELPPVPDNLFMPRGESKDLPVLNKFVWLKWEADRTTALMQIIRSLEKRIEQLENSA